MGDWVKYSLVKPVCYSQIPLAPSLENSLNEYVQVVYEEPTSDEYFLVESQQFFAYQFKDFFQVANGAYKAVGFSKSSKKSFNHNYDFVDNEGEHEGVEYLGLRRIASGDDKAFPILKDHLELKKTLFLDRDGVLMTDHGYVSDIENVEVLPTDEIEQQIERTFERLEEQIQRVRRDVEILGQISDRREFYNGERNLYLEWCIVDRKIHYR